MKIQRILQVIIVGVIGGLLLVGLFFIMSKIVTLAYGPEFFMVLAGLVLGRIEPQWLWDMEGFLTTPIAFIFVSLLMTGIGGLLFYLLAFDIRLWVVGTVGGLIAGKFYFAHKDLADMGAALREMIY